MDHYVIYRRPLKGSNGDHLHEKISELCGKYGSTLSQMDLPEGDRVCDEHEVVRVIRCGAEERFSACNESEQ